MKFRISQVFKLAVVSSLFFVNTANSNTMDGAPIDTVNVDSTAEANSLFLPSSQNMEVMIRSSRKSAPLLTAIDYHTRNIYLINYERDILVTVDPFLIKGWPGDLPLQHTVVSASGERLVFTTDSSPSEPARAIEVKVNEINWNARTAKLEVAHIYQLTEPDAAPLLPFVTAVNNVQNVAPWTLATVRQIHGPTLLPRTNLLYLTDWTSDQVRVIDMDNNKLARFDPISYDGYTEQTHGVVFNDAGTIGLGSGYFYDNSYIDLYAVNKSGKIRPKKKILLGDDISRAGFSHYVSWVDNRYAYTATMQLDKTSLTPSSVERFIGPSVWLIDAWTGKATQVLDQTFDVDGNGVFRSASDIAVAGGKLFIAEEDTLDYEFGEDGYVSIFSLLDPLNPKLIKRLKAGDGLPPAMRVAHTLSETPDERFIYTASWVSGYLVKIDVKKDKVVKVFGPDDGLVMPHGIYISGGIR